LHSADLPLTAENAYLPAMERGFLLQARSCRALIASVLAIASSPVVGQEAEAGDDAVPILEEPGFEEGFSEFDIPLAPHDHPEHAVDISIIEPPLEPAPGEVIEYMGRAHASFYGRRFAGRLTASGETFDPRQFTAAHRTLPFGSLVRVTNPRNGRSVIVRVNDRGPFIAGREIDLSRAAAEEIGIVRRGVGEVELELIAP
jgi:rare lipoprotein A